MGKNVYICQNGFILTRLNNNILNDIKYKVYGTDDYLSTITKNKCATESKRKIKDRHESEINKIKKMYYSYLGQKKSIQEEDQMLKRILKH